MSDRTTAAQALSQSGHLDSKMQCTMHLKDELGRKYINRDETEWTEGCYFDAGQKKRLRSG
jgi:hypothetical protein